MNHRHADILVKAIEIVMNVTLEQMRSRSKESAVCTARPVFLGVMEKTDGFRAEEAAAFLQRGVREINHLRENHRDWMKSNPEYKLIFSSAMLEYKSRLPEVNDIELEELRADIEFRIEKLTERLNEVLRQQQARNFNSNQKPK